MTAKEKRARPSQKPKKVWQKIDGLVLLDKPEGVTSNGLLQTVRRLFNAKKAGHTGALDPFATGLLPICFGEGTKVSGLLLDADKTYLATLKLGIATDSGDKDGHIALTAEVPVLSQSQIETVLTQFLGKISQVPPMYSALKYQGKPLYEYARAGIEIERPARQVTIFDLQLVDWQADQIRFSVHCSKGTYVRTLGEDIAKALGTLGHLTALRRTQAGHLTLKQAHRLEALTDFTEQQRQATLLPLDTPLPDLAALHLDANQAKWVLQGGKLNLPQPSTPLVRFYNEHNIFIGVGEWQVEKQLIKPKRLFNL